MKVEEQKATAPVRTPSENEKAFVPPSDTFFISDEEIDLRKEEILMVLRPEEKQLLHMVYDEKMSYRAIAELLNSNRQAIAMRVFRLRKKIAVLFKSTIF